MVISKLHCCLVPLCKELKLTHAVKKKKDGRIGKGSPPSWRIKDQDVTRELRVDHSKKPRRSPPVPGTLHLYGGTNIGSELQPLKALFGPH